MLEGNKERGKEGRRGREKGRGYREGREDQGSKPNLCTKTMWVKCLDPSLD